MKSSGTITLGCIFCMGLLWAAGCSNPSSRPELAGQPSLPPATILQPGSTPSELAILPLTRLTQPSAPDTGAYIQVYVTMADEFGVNLKYFGTVRFELYEKIQRSAEPKGKRIKMWDVDLSTPQLNQQYWEDWVRAYEFHLKMSPPPTQKCILQVTFLGVDGRRVSAQASLDL